MMIVILLGQIDLSVPWVVSTVGGMMACAAAAYGPAGEMLAIPFGIVCGMAIGLANGIGVAYLRIPSMIITLATNAVAQGLMVVYTGGFSPQDSATPAMRYLATGLLRPRHTQCRAHLGRDRCRHGLCLLTRTTFGRSVYGIGNRERAAYLSGINTRRIVLVAFVVSGALSAFGGGLLAGYASKAAQSMGDAYLLPSIAAVVLGGTSILGGRGSYLGTVAGRHPDHPAAIHPLGHADAGGRTGRSSTASSSSPCCCFTAAALPTGHPRPYRIYPVANLSKSQNQGTTGQSGARSREKHRLARCKRPFLLGQFDSDRAMVAADELP